MFDPFALWRLSVEIGQIAVESQMIMARRMMGLTGFAPMAKGERLRMVTEKSEAMTQSGLAAGRAVMAGKSATEVLAAAVKPIRRRTRANAKRLGRVKTT